MLSGVARAASASNFFAWICLAKTLGNGRVLLIIGSAPHEAAPAFAKRHPGGKRCEYYVSQHSSLLFLSSPQRRLAMGKALTLEMARRVEEVRLMCPPQLYLATVLTQIP